VQEKKEASSNPKTKGMTKQHCTLLEIRLQKEGGGKAVSRKGKKTTRKSGRQGQRPGVQKLKNEVSRARDEKLLT